MDPGQFRSAARRTLRVALIAFLLAGFAPRGAGAETRVALLPVVVHAPAEEGAYLGAGLLDMLSARLEQYPGIEVVVTPPTAPAEVDAAARAAGASYVVHGSFTRFGDGASLDLRCQRVGAGDPGRRVFVQSGTLGEIIPKIDGLAEKIAHHVLGKVPATGSAAAAAPSAAVDAGYAELLRRVEALEGAVYAPAPVAEGAAQ